MLASSDTKSCPEAEAHTNASAKSVPASCTTIQLSIGGPQRFAELMSAPPKPSETMVALGTLEDFEECAEEREKATS